MNPDLQFAELASSHWTISPYSFSGPDGGRTHHTDLARVSRLPGTCQPTNREVRPGVEPGLPPYRGGVPPEHRQTVFPAVIPDGVEPSLSWLSPRRLRRWTTGSSLVSSDRGGSRTHRHEALDLAAMPICVPGRGGSGSRTRRSRLTNLRSVPGPDEHWLTRSCRPRYRAGRPGLMEASWAPAAPAMCQ